jgi:hypothetical protein
VIPDVSKECAAFIFRGQEVQKCQNWMDGWMDGLAE